MKNPNNMCLQFSPPFSPGRRQASQQIPQQRHSLPYISRRNNEKAPGQPRPTRRSSQKWRRRWDSNPRAVLPTTRFRVELVMTASIRLRMIFPTSVPRIWGELMGRTKGFSKWAKPGRPCNDWVCEAHASKMQKWFRVELVMTASIRLRMIYPTSAPRIWGELMGRTKGFSKWAKPGRPCNDWVCEADTSKMQTWFRVELVMTASIRLQEGYGGIIPAK